MQKSRPKGADCKVVVERSHSAATSRKLWKGLIRFNREQAGPLRYSRTVLSARDEKGRLLGGLITQSWWQETYIELLWLCLLYTSDAADERSSVDLGGRRII